MGISWLLFPLLWIRIFYNNILSGQIAEQVTLSSTLGELFVSDIHLVLNDSKFHREDIQESSKFWGRSSYCVCQNVPFDILKAWMQPAKVLGKATISVFPSQEE